MITEVAVEACRLLMTAYSYPLLLCIFDILLIAIVAGNLSTYGE